MRSGKLIVVFASAVGLIPLVAGVPVVGGGESGGDQIFDLTTYAEFSGCLGDPEVGVDPSCAAFDFDFDGDVDLVDFARFEHAFGLSIPPGMVLVPAGTFQMGDSWSEGSSIERPVHPVDLSPYSIDKYEVTNAQYAAALNWALAQGNQITVTGGVVYKYNSGTSYLYCDTTTSSSHSRITWNGSTFGVASGKEDHPMVMVSWYGAAAYSNWRSAMEGRQVCYDLSTWECNFGVAGYRLPTEAEWEKAAAWDPEQQKHFRFGEHSDGCGYNCLDAHRANYGSSGDPFESGGYPWTTPVGYYDGSNHGGYQTQNAQSYYGCYDMSGNAWEWCNDWYLGTYYSSSPGSNPTGPGEGTYRVLRGGGWDGGPSGCRSAGRAGGWPGVRYGGLGFRCVLGTP